MESGTRAATVATAQKCLSSGVNLAKPAMWKSEVLVLSRTMRTRPSRPIAKLPTRTLADSPIVVHRLSENLRNLKR